MTRMRVVHVTGESYLLVFDKAAPEDHEDLAASATGDHRPAGCAGMLVFASELEVE